jgi:hypothetical protein
VYCWGKALVCQNDLGVSFLFLFGPIGVHALPLFLYIFLVFQKLSQSSEIKAKISKQES